MPTTRTRYVDPDVSGGAGNGTSWANAYSSLNAAEDAEDASGALTTSDEVVVFICGHNGASQSTADTAATTFIGWTTDATRYIEIKTETADRHAGVWSTTKYRLEDDNANVLTINEEYVRVDGLQIAKTGSNGNQACVYYWSIGASNDCRVSNCILKQDGNNSYAQSALTVSDTDGNVVMWNCVCYGGGTVNAGANAVLYLNCATANIYGCTVIGSAYGINRVAGTVNVKNCYSGGTAVSDLTGTITYTTCACEDNLTLTGVTKQVPYDTNTFQSVTPGNANYLKPTNTGALYGAGTTLTDDPPGSTALGVDIAGTTRS